MRGFFDLSRKNMWYDLKAPIFCWPQRRAKGWGKCEREFGSCFYQRAKNPLDVIPRFCRCRQFSAVPPRLLFLPRPQVVASCRQTLFLESDIEQKIQSNKSCWA